jgi:type III restriction enzyme
VHTLDDLKAHRLQEVAFTLAKLTLETYFRDDDGADKPWLFPQLLHIARDWLDRCVTCKDNCFKQMLLLEELAHDAADRIYGAIVRGEEGEKRLKPILRPYDTLGSTRYVDFDTTRPVYLTNPEKCHISHVVADTESWEQKMAQVLEDMPEVVSYAKNQNLGFWIPYTLNGEERNYQPDFIVRLRVGAGETSGRASGAEAPADGDLLNLIVEVSGEPRRDKIAKTTTARDLWVPAVNNHGGFGRWGFLEITDP